jgi:hypothetical protein
MLKSSFLSNFKKSGIPGKSGKLTSLPVQAPVSQQWRSSIPSGVIWQALHDRLYPFKIVPPQIKFNHFKNGQISGTKS